ncbi:MAG TPA: hypothetical protein VLM85_03280 [Polyangiaceae bacterium]|nr:hypothetical protein [Polyangiaceae bacterium]
MPTLTVLVDGVPMAEAEARAFWGRFSAHMELHKGDLAGFAKAEGFASVKPALGPDGPQLLASRSGTQVPYANAKAGPSGSKAGSPSHQARAPRPPKNRQKRR